MEFKLDVHSHTIASGHAFGTVSEMAAAAAESGFELFGITEHAKGIPGTCTDIYFKNLRVLPRQLYGIEMMFGSEINIIDYNGRLSLDNELMEEFLDIRIAGIHELCYKIGDEEQNTAAYLGAMKHPLVDIISHPDDGWIPINYEALVLGAKETKTLLEVNNSSLCPESFRVNARENYFMMLDLCRKHNVPVIVNSDAHTPYAVGDLNEAKALLSEVDFPEELVVNRSVKAFKEALSNKRN